MKKLTMKELPGSEKPYEKCLLLGAEQLSDAELIAAIIRTGTRDDTSIQLAERLLSKGPHQLMNLSRLSMEQLQEIPGIGPVKAVQLKCILELSVRIARQSFRDGIVLNQPETIANYYMQQLRHKTRENLILSMFDNKCSLLGDELLAIGAINFAPVSPREVFLSALEKKAVHIVLIHNHPSGDPRPSKDDFLVTKRIHQAGELLGIHLVDHIIIGDNDYYSFRQENIF